MSNTVPTTRRSPPCSRFRWRFFRQDPRDHTHRIDYQGRSWYVPAYRYGEYKIWGLSAIMIVELVNVLFDAGISLHQPPERYTQI